LYAHLDYVSPPDDPPPANPPNKTKPGKSKRGTPSQSVASVRSSEVLTDPETEAPSAQTQETTGQKASICPSVQSVRENADTNDARASVLAQTDRTDRQLPAQATEEARQSSALDLSGDLSRGDRKTDCRQIAAINQPAAPDDFPELPTFLRRVPGNPHGNRHRTRHLLNQEFMQALLLNFRHQGKKAIEKVARDQPGVLRFWCLAS
jgi:hypothetical protein